MYLNIGVLMYPELQYGYLVLPIIATVLMLALCFLPSKRPGIVGFLCLAAALAGIITSAILLSSFGTFGINVSYYFFCGLFNILIFLPVFVFFHLTTRQKQHTDHKKAVSAIVYIGYLWSLVAISASIALTALQAIATDAVNPQSDPGTGQEAVRKTNQVSGLYFYSSWGFVVFCLIITALCYKSIQERSKRRALILFNVFTVISIITNTVIPNIDWTKIDLSSAKTLGYMSIIFVDLPNSLAIVVWFIGFGQKTNKHPGNILPDELETPKTSDGDNTPVNTSNV